MYLDGSHVPVAAHCGHNKEPASAVAMSAYPSVACKRSIHRCGVRRPFLKVEVFASLPRTRPPLPLCGGFRSMDPWRAISQRQGQRCQPPTASPWPPSRPWARGCSCSRGSSTTRPTRRCRTLREAQLRGSTVSRGLRAHSWSSTEVRSHPKRGRCGDCP